MKKVIAVVSPHKPSLVKNTSVPQGPRELLWFYEIEALWAFVQRKPVDEVFCMAPRTPCNEKYVSHIQDMHPRVSIFLAEDPPSLGPSLCESDHLTIFPKLSDIFLPKAMSCSFQPIVRLDEPNCWIGLECLSRVGHQGVNYDLEFLFLYAQEKRLLVQKDKLCMQNCLKHAPRVGSLLLFINVRLQTLISEDFSRWISAEVALHGFLPQHIVLEITEQYTYANEEDLKRALSDLRNMGFFFAYDDFGSGLCNLALLELMRPDFLKVSGRFIKDIHHQDVRKQLTQSILDLSRGFSIQTILENIEQEEELQCLRHMGAQYGQGFLFSEPMSKAELTKALAKRSKLNMNIAEPG